MDLKQNQTYIKNLKKQKDQNIIIFPTSIFIPYYIKEQWIVGIQNIHAEDSGSYTGQVSAKQASSLNITYAFINHPEVSKENENKKIKECLKYNINPIICISEEKIESQLKNLLYTIEKEQINKIYFAYEPIKIVGKNTHLNINKIRNKIIYIKNYIESIYQISPIILYGGNINSKNIDQLNQIPEISGFIIGRAALDIKELMKIIKVVKS